MPVAIATLESYVSKEAVLHLKNEDDSLEEITGVIKAASPAGIAFKPKGRGGLRLVDPADVEEIQDAPYKPKPVLQKNVRPIPEGSMRQHLADRHGIALSWCREATEEQAAEFHESIDHSDLGHKHREIEVNDSSDSDSDDED